MAASMNARRSAATCRWATPTLFLRAPFWFDAENDPWTCMRGADPRVLASTDSCAVCPKWEPRPGKATADALEQGQGGARADVPPMMDWFGAFLPPHETIDH